MYLLLIAVPFLGSLLAGIFGRLIGSRGAAIISTSSVIISAFCSGIVFFEVALSGSPCTIKFAPWFISELYDATWGFYFDSLTAVMVVVITWVSSAVHVYSISYMSHDPHLPRFMSYLSIFTFFMLMLVTADNFLQMFFGWEGVGLASYLLISFWFTRLQASKASIKAMIMNRIGDFGLALGIMSIFYLCKSVDFCTVFSCAPHLAKTSIIFCNIEVHALTLTCILLFIGAVGKSAQIGLHTWLPDAMEGPTPVSALIHAATMVTAGVFLIARSSPLFEYSPTALALVTIVGSMTCFFAATTGIVQNDLKRVIAYSTCSQLGYMVFACGTSHYSLGIFHLMNHAFFKALLFLTAGSVIHSLGDEQDIRKMGGTLRVLPFTYGMMLIGSLSLVGFPFLTGFYSKDVILEVAAASYTLSGNFAYWLGSFCVALTSYYSFRLLFLTFLAGSNSYKKSIETARDAPLIMALPLFFLAIGSIFVGFFGKEMMIGLGTDFWGNALFMLPQNGLLFESEFIPQGLKFIPLIFTFFGATIAWIVTTRLSPVVPKPSEALGWQNYTNLSLVKLYTMLNKRWFFDKVYNDFIAKKALTFGYKISFKTLDKGVFEILGPSGIALTFQLMARHISKLQSGMVYHYAVVMLLGLTLMITGIGLWSFCQSFMDNRLYFIFLVSFPFYNFVCETMSSRSSS